MSVLGRAKNKSGEEKIKKYRDEMEKDPDIDVIWTSDPYEILPPPDITSHKLNEILIFLPDHLRKTGLTIYRLGRATAEEVSEQTRRARAVESNYLNQLVMMGYLKKDRKNRKVYFFIEK